MSNFTNAGNDRVHSTTKLNVVDLSSELQRYVVCAFLAENDLSAILQNWNETDSVVSVGYQMLARNG